MLRVRDNIDLVVYSLTRIFDVDAKVGDVVIKIIFLNFDYIGAFDWTSDEHPPRRSFCLCAAHE